MFSAIACNRVNQGIDAQDNLVIYCAGQYVALWETELELLKGHTDKVTCLSFLAPGVFVSGSADKTCRLWFKKEKWESIVLSHEAGLVAVGGLGGVLATADSKSNVYIWSFLIENSRLFSFR